jgi:hypothetical protein
MPPCEQKHPSLPYIPQTAQTPLVLCLMLNNHRFSGAANVQAADFVVFVGSGPYLLRMWGQHHLPTCRPLRKFAAGGHGREVHGYLSALWCCMWLGPEVAETGRLSKQCNWCPKKLRFGKGNSMKFQFHHGWGPPFVSWFRNPTVVSPVNHASPLPHNNPTPASTLGLRTPL